MQGRLITFEGPDGSGKSTQIKHLAQYLKDRGYTVILSREPGGTPVGEKLRAIVLNEQMCSMAELLLFATMRAEHVESLIKPAIARGDIVISDRFSDSSYAYQGKGRGYTDMVLTLEQLVLQGFEPDYTLYFEISLEESKRRFSTRGDGVALDRFETENNEFITRVFAGYRERFDQNPHRMHPIQSLGTPDEVRARLLQWADDVFIPANPLP